MPEFFNPQPAESSRQQLPEQKPNTPNILPANAPIFTEPLRSDRPARSGWYGHSLYGAGYQSF